MLGSIKGPKEEITFSRDIVSVHSTDVEKMAKITIDRKRMYIYRADYTIYDVDLLK